jgi:hypothetical protein
MMRWLGRAILAAILVGVGLWIYTLLFPPPERVIRKRLNQLAKCVSFASNESPLAAAANTQKLVNFFTPDLEIKITVPGGSSLTLQGRDELLENAMAARKASGSLQVQFLDPQLLITADRLSADVHLIVKAKVGRDGELIVQQLKLVLNKVERDWKIKTIETVKTLSNYYSVERGG